jgi:hypothetical protein
VLDQRLARGEIDVEVYRQIRDELDRSRAVQSAGRSA